MKTISLILVLVLIIPAIGNAICDVEHSEIVKLQNKLQMYQDQLYELQVKALSCELTKMDRAKIKGLHTLISITGGLLTDVYIRLNTCLHNKSN